MAPLPRTIYVWLAVLTASTLLGDRLPARVVPPRTPAARESLSGPDFQRYVDAEYALRLHYGLPANAATTLEKPAAHYRRLATDLPLPNFPRRVLILDHQRKKPLDTALLDRLAADLRAQEKGEREIQAELALWRALYGKQTDSGLPAGAVARVKAMHLRFLENQALADLARVRHDTKAQEAAEAQRDTQARRSASVLVSVGLLMLLAGVLGSGLLLLALLAGLNRQARWLGQVERPEEKVGWATFVDGFVFYLALYRGLGVSLALLVRALALSPPVLPIQLLLQGGTGLAAMAYVAAAVRRSGGSLRALGWTRRSLGINILYGIAAYTATLPLSFLLSRLSERLFHDNPNTTPNPVLPLLVGSGSVIDRVLIFVMAACFAPFFEEFFFRGALFSGLRQRFGSALGILFSAVAFAVVHPLQDWLPIFGLGVILALVRELRQSLVPGMVVHFLQNGLAYLMLTTLFSG